MQIIIQDYIKDTYIAPSVCFELLCKVMTNDVGFYERHRRVLDQFRFTIDRELIVTSMGQLQIQRNNGKNNEDAFQYAIQFITTRIDETYRLVFNIWICLVFEIDIAGVTNATIDAIMNDNLPQQLYRLLSYNIAEVFCSITRTVNYNAETPSNKALFESSIKNKVTDIVFQYVRLYKFLKQPYVDNSEDVVRNMQFSKADGSLNLLLEVMIYKFFDSLHTLSIDMFENYIILIRNMFDTLILIIVSFDGIDRTNRMKIDAAMSHFAIFLMMIPKCSEILFVRQNIVNRFRAELNEYEKENIKTRNLSIFVTQHKVNKEQKHVSLFDLEVMLREGGKHTEKAQEIFDTTLNVSPMVLPQGGLMSEKTLFNTLHFADGVCSALTISSDNMIQVVSERFEKSKRDPFHYLTFLNDIFIELNNISREKARLLICDFSQLCSLHVPVFKLKVIGQFASPPQPQPQPQPHNNRSKW